MKAILSATVLSLGLSACGEAASGEAERDMDATQTIDLKQTNAEQTGAEQTNEGQTATQQGDASEAATLQQMPEAFRGKWESSFAPDNCDAEYSQERLLVEAERLRFSGAAAQFGAIERIDSDTVRAAATVSTYDGESDETYRLTLGKDAQTLSLAVEGLDEPFDYIRCPG